MADQQPGSLEHDRQLPQHPGARDQLAQERQVLPQGLQLAPIVQQEGRDQLTRLGVEPLRKRVFQRADHARRPRAQAAQRRRVGLGEQRLRQGSHRQLDGGLHLPLSSAGVSRTARLRVRRHRPPADRGRGSASGATEPGLLDAAFLSTLLCQCPGVVRPLLYEQRLDLVDGAFPLGVGRDVLGRGADDGAVVVPALHQFVGLGAEARGLERTRTHPVVPVPDQEQPRGAAGQRRQRLGVDTVHCSVGADVVDVHAVDHADEVGRHVPAAVGPGAGPFELPDEPLPRVIAPVPVPQLGTLELPTGLDRVPQGTQRTGRAAEFRAEPGGQVGPDPRGCQHLTVGGAERPSRGAGRHRVEQAVAVGGRGHHSHPALRQRLLLTHGHRVQVDAHRCGQ